MDNGWTERDGRFSDTGPHGTGARKGDAGMDSSDVASPTTVAEQNALGRMRSEAGGASKYATGMANASGRYNVASHLPKSDGSA